MPTARTWQEGNRSLEPWMNATTEFLINALRIFAWLFQETPRDCETCSLCDDSNPRALEGYRV